MGDADTSREQLSPETFSAAVTAVTTAFGDPTRRDIYLFAREEDDGVTTAEVAERGRDPFSGLAFALGGRGTLDVGEMADRAFGERLGHGAREARAAGRAAPAPRCL